MHLLDRSDRGHRSAPDGTPERDLVRAPQYSAKTLEAKPYEGHGTGLKPAREDWVLMQKPLSEKTIAANVLRWGTGALNIDASRIPPNTQDGARAGALGRWPSTVIHDGSDEVLAMFAQFGEKKTCMSASKAPVRRQHLQGIAHPGQFADGLRRSRPLLSVVPGDR
jgi:hypothetical protein